MKHDTEKFSGNLTIVNEIISYESCFVLSFLLITYLKFSRECHDSTSKSEIL